MQYYILHSVAIAMTECRSVFEFTSDTPYITLMGKLWNNYQGWF